MISWFRYYSNICATPWQEINVTVCFPLLWNMLCWATSALWDTITLTRNYFIIYNKTTGLSLFWDNAMGDNTQQRDSDTKKPLTELEYTSHKFPQASFSSPVFLTANKLLSQQYWRRWAGNVNLYTDYANEAAVYRSDEYISFWKQSWGDSEISSHILRCSVRHRSIINRNLPTLSEVNE